MTVKVTNRPAMTKSPNPDTPRDWCTCWGASELAGVIRSFWAKRGYVVNMTVKENPEKVHKSSGRGVWVVRSNLVGGRPRC